MFHDFDHHRAAPPCSGCGAPLNVPHDPRCDTLGADARARSMSIFASRSPVQAVRSREQVLDAVQMAVDALNQELRAAKAEGHVLQLEQIQAGPAPSGALRIRLEIEIGGAE